ncbi:MAG: tyrosine-type recombinase/integrase [Williamsia sp.]|nr:tyrosine-type recombinase/integrase [Williamsia sp.]
MRYSLATHLIDNGSDLHTVKELLGHSNLSTTMQYLHMSIRRIQGVVNPYDLLEPEVVKSFNAVAGIKLLDHIS